MKFSGICLRYCTLIGCLSALTLTLHAGWRAGLNEGKLTGVSDFALGTFPESTTAVPGPQKGREKSWGNSTTYVYTGQIYLDGKTWFGESIDDGTYLKINGVVLINDKSWNNFATGSIAYEAGWYDFELRFYNGGGGCGVANNAVDSSGASCGFGMLVGETKPSAMSACTFPLDDGTMSLFRCDDGLGFPDELLVTQSPVEYPVALSPATKTTGLAENDTLDCSCATSYENEAANERATLRGYVLSNRVDGVAAERACVLDGTSAFTYTHDGKSNVLTWLWNVEYKLTVATQGSGSVDVETAWHAAGETVTLTATGMFAGWAGDVPTERLTTNPLTVTMDQARSITAIFGEATVYVDAKAGDDAQSGMTPDLPVRTLATALTKAGSGYVVHVMPGTYDVTAELLVDKAVTLRGEGATPADVVVNGPKKEKVRVFHLDNAGARLENLTISGGNCIQAIGNGGGVLIDANGGTVTNCVITDCMQQYRVMGGGVYVNSDAGLVTHCRITGCYTFDGNAFGGTAVGIGRGRVEYCLIDDNFDTQTIAPNSDKLGAVYMEGGVLDHCTVVDNENVACTIYLTGGYVSNCVFAANHSFYYAQDKQINATAALRASAFANSVWDLGDISPTCPKGKVVFADFAARDYRLADGSAGRVPGGVDWGYVEADESIPLPAAAAPVRIEVAAGGDLADALRRVAEGGEIVLGVGTHKTVGYRPYMLKRPVTLRGEGTDNAAVKLTRDTAFDDKNRITGVITLSNADAKLLNLTVCDNRPNGSNNCSSGIHMVQDGGLVSNCVVRNVGMLSTSSHSGAAIRIRRAGAHVTCSVISNCVIHANTDKGGCVALEAEGSMIDNCLICDCNNDTWNQPTSSHYSKDSAGAVYIEAGTIANCTIVNCKAPLVAGIKTSTNNKASGGVVRECIIYGNTRTNEAYPAVGAVGWGPGTNSWQNVVSDVMALGTGARLATADTIGFVDFANGDCHITGESVAWNAGPRHPVAGTSPVDLDGEPRRAPPHVDAGCYEGPLGNGFGIFVR